MRIKITDPRVYIPGYATLGSAGIDLQAVLEDVTCIEPNKTLKVNTGISIWINDPGVCGLILPRSGTGEIGVVLGNLAGVLDSDYQGEIKLILWNRTSRVLWITPFDRVAQIIFTSVLQPVFQVVKEFESNTIRGCGGFGSTN